MAQGYPSRKRVRKAYWRGVKTAKTGRGFNPYRNAVLKELFDRGRSRGDRPGPGGPRPSGNSVQATPSAFGRSSRMGERRRGA